jgi:hypothetical protein
MARRQRRPFGGLIDRHARRKEQTMFEDNGFQAINDRCLAEALSVRDMLSPAPRRRSRWAAGHAWLEAMRTRVQWRISQLAQGLTRRPALERLPPIAGGRS